MKKAFFSVGILLLCCFIITGCIKNTPYVTTLTPYMTASIGTYNFTASTVAPSLLDTQKHDTTLTLLITGTSSDVAHPYDKIVLSVSKYKVMVNTYSIVMGQAGAGYLHNGIADPAVGGIVAITKVTNNSLIGYFSFQTASGLNITNGAFSVGKPWDF